MESDEKTKNQTVFKEESHPVGTEVNEKSSTGLDENLAGLLCYLFGFITGIIFLILEKENQFVRFHALQSIFISAFMLILSIVLTSIPIIGWLMGILLSPLSLVLWIFLMLKAYQGKKVMLPVLGELAEKQLVNMEIKK